MREILFKAQRADGMGWVEGDLSQDKLTGKAYIHYEYHEAPTYGDPGGCDIVQTHEVIPETVGQSIDFQDDEGVKVFENHKVTVRYRGKLRDGVVIYDDRTNAFVVSINDSELLVPFDALNSVLVIGNIFDK